MRNKATLAVVLLVLALAPLGGCTSLGEKANADGTELSLSTPQVEQPTTQPTAQAEDTIHSSGTGVASPQAVDMFILIDGIEGESMDKDHKGWIDILSFNHEVIGPAPIDSLHSSPPAMGEFSITKAVDSASPKLFLFACEGTVVPTMTLEMRRSHGDGQTVMRYKLDQVVVTKVYDRASPHLATYDSGATPTGSLPVEEVPFAAELTEQVSLNYSQIQWEHLVVGLGGVEQTVSTGWSIAANKAL